MTTFVLPDAFLPDPDDVAFRVERRRRAAQEKVAHYFEWEGVKVDGKSYVEKGRTFCQDYRKRRTGIDVPKVVCPDCLAKFATILADHHATCEHGASCTVHMQGFTAAIAAATER